MISLHQTTAAGRARVQRGPSPGAKAERYARRRAGRRCQAPDRHRPPQPWPAAGNGGPWPPSACRSRYRSHRTRCCLMIWRISTSEGTRSEESKATRAPGKRSATSSAIRSTPGPQATREFDVAALRTLFRNRQGETAMMTVEAMPIAMLDQPGGALRAVETVATRTAQRQRRIAAPIEEQERLLTLLERLRHGARPGRGPATCPSRVAPCACRS